MPLSREQWDQLSEDEKFDKFKDLEALLDDSEDDDIPAPAVRAQPVATKNFSSDHPALSGDEYQKYLRRLIHAEIEREKRGAVRRISDNHYVWEKY